MFHSKFEECDLNQFMNEEKGYIHLFGYGSLLWKVDFEFESKTYGYVENFERHFWLLSDDHRGTPENLGRVLTLVNSTQPSSRVYGVAYKILTTDLAETFRNLNIREKCGYSMQDIIFQNSNDIGGQPIKCVCYFANEDNHYFSPQTDTVSLADQIWKSIGPSGTNKEYLFNACKALRDLAGNNDEYLAYDRHLFELEEAVKSLE